MTSSSSTRAGAGQPTAAGVGLSCAMTASQVVATLVASAAGDTFAQLRVVGRRFWFVLILAALMVPHQRLRRGLDAGPSQRGDYRCVCLLM